MWNRNFCFYLTQNQICLYSSAHKDKSQSFLPKLITTNLFWSPYSRIHLQKRPIICLSSDFSTYNLFSHPTSITSCHPNFCQLFVRKDLNPHPISGSHPCLRPKFHLKLKERKVKTLTRNWRDHKTTGTHKHTETVLRYFDWHGRLSQSKESKCLWTHDKDSITREFMKGATRGLREGWKEGNYLRLMPGLSLEDRTNW